MEDKFSFYFQKNNSLFNGDVLSICYTASSRDVLKYGLTSDKVIIIMKNPYFCQMNQSNDCDYKKEIEKAFLNKKIILRIQSECFLGLYGDSHCDCESQRLNSIKIIGENDGIFVHVPQEAQGWC